MNKIYNILIIVLFICFSNNIIFAKPIIFGDFNNVQYVKNYDGDTITVNILKVHPLLGYHINIRIRGIDCPEIRSHCLKEKQLAIKAKNIVHQICSTGNQLILKNVSRGKYFRIIADVYVGQINLKDILLKNHVAVLYDGRKKINWSEYLNSTN